MSRSLKLLARASAIALGLTFLPVAMVPALAEDVRVDEDLTLVRYRSETIQGLRIAYREAGDPSNPTILLLHGFPTSSNMFRDLIPRIATHWHVIAPDYPGFGASDMPQADAFEYSFTNLARIMTELLDRKGIDRYAAYVMDYGAPVGFRMFAAHPERVTAFVIQNGNAYEEGLREFWDPIRAYWADPSAENGDKLRSLLTLEGTKWQYHTGMQNPDRVNPDNYWHVQYLLDRPMWPSTRNGRRCSANTSPRRC